jgi:hypothetical protein
MNHQKFANFILRQIKDGNEVKLPNISRADYEKIKELLSKEQVEFDDVTQTFKPKKSTTENATSTVNENAQEQVNENKPQEVTKKEEQEQEVTVKDNATVTTNVTTSVQQQQVNLVSVELEKKNETTGTQEHVEHDTASTQEEQKTTFVRVHLIMSQEVEQKIKEVTGIDRTTKAIYHIVNEYFKSKGMEEPFKVKKEKKRLNIFEEM